MTVNLRLPRLTTARALAARLPLIALAALAGCANTRPQQAPLDVQQVQRFEAQGYPGSGARSTSTTRQTWTLQDRAVELEWSVPDGAGPYPLVIYMPGLGQDEHAGQRWRLAWTRAGYAVLSLQPLPADMDAVPGGSRRPPRGRPDGPPPDLQDDTPPRQTHDEPGSGRPRGFNDTFNPQAKARFSGDVMRERIAVLQALLSQARQRSAQGQAPVNQVDLTRIAVAGFDLGAYTSMALAGERIGGVRPGPDTPGLRAFIALSPYANFADSGFDTRYLDIHAPVLSISAESDTDPTGLVSGAYLRSAPYKGMPPGDKFLLILQNADHPLLGDETPLRGEQPGSGPGELGGHGGGSSPDRQDRGGGGARGPGGGGSAGGGMGGGGRNGGPGDANRAQQVSPTARAMGQVAIQDVTVAFLDTYLRDDTIAREWLTRNAPRWLGTQAQLQSK